MFTATSVILAIFVYMGLLFAFAQWSERTAVGRRWASHPAVYALGLAVYCTTWTYYGSVGKAAAGGMGYLPVYLGPTIALLAGGAVFRRIARLKHAHRVTSIADFVSARFGKSQAVAGLTTLLLAVGIVPYIALQVKAVTGSFTMLTAGTGASALGAWFGPIVVVLMIVFTIVFGIRHLDPTERHPGMVVSLAAESLVKLVAFIAAAAFVVGSAFGSVFDFSSRLDALARATPLMGRSSPTDVASFVTVTVLSAAAFAFLPRQFHVGIVENGSPKQVRTAQWLMPLYLVAINAFVVPLAFGGKMLARPGTSPDFYVLALPLQAGKSGLSLAVFMGGFSAAIGMIMIESMTMATMISNHVVMPLAQAFRPLHGLRRRMLPVRWVAAAAVIVAGYQFAVKVGASYPLVSIGLISFAAAFVLAPIVLGGLYFREANRAGALLGLGAGFVTWFYTLLVPTFVKSGWIGPKILTAGPLGIGLLRPEALLGWEGLPSLVHGTLFCSLATVTFFVGGSLVFRTSKEETVLADAFLGDAAEQLALLDGTHATVDVAHTFGKAREILLAYLSAVEVDAALSRIAGEVGCVGKEKMTAVQLAETHNEVERTLSGAIGAAAAYGALKQLGHIDRKDKKALERELARTLAELKLSPKELKTRIDFQKEREALLEDQFRALNEKIVERDREIEQRVGAERALQQAHDQLELRVEERTKALAARERSMRLLLDSTGDGLIPVALDGTLLAERSRSVDYWFGEPAEGVTLGAYLAPHDPRVQAGLAMGFEQLAEDFLPFEVNASQMPHRIERDGRSFDLDYKQVFEEGVFARVLVLVRDVTASLAGERAEREAREQQAVIAQLLRDKKGFTAFVHDAERIIAGLGQEADLVTTRRELHTLKGNAAIMGFSALSAECHAVEDWMAEEPDRAPGEAQRGALSTLLGLRLKAIEGFFSMDRGETVEIRAAEHKRLLERIRARRDYDELLAVVESFRWERTADHLSRLGVQIQRIAQKLDKPVEVLQYHHGLRMPPGPLDELWPVLVHVVRNAVDHGLEPAEERVAAGKPGTGQVRLETRLEDDGTFLIEVADDGRGVDLAGLTAAAKRRGLATDGDTLGLMCRDGLSTREQVTDVSGRGVGMGAVREACQRAGGRVSVQSIPGKGTVFTFRFPRARAPLAFASVFPAALSSSPIRLARSAP